MTKAQFLAAANSLPDGDLYALLVGINTLYHQRKMEAAREAQKKVEACKHQWQTIFQGVTIAEERCELCGVTWWIDSSG